MLAEKLLEEMKASLFAGHYNLLLGSGISLDSKNQLGDPIIGAWELTDFLCKLKGAKPNTPLSRVTSLLLDSEVTEHLTNRYHGCKPGPTVNWLTSFVWKTAFTFNIDDALESAYQANANRKQTWVSINYDSEYRTNFSPSEIPIVHLHGFVREPEKKYVFSTSEYGRVTRGQNPWMHVLSELLSSEPFIIAGTSLNESDLEYYLSGRTESSPRKNRGPSILVEPSPDTVTEHDCARHGLILVKATLAEFLSWLDEKIGKAPTVAELSIPSKENIFYPKPPNLKQIAFFSAFELVRPITTSTSVSQLSPFFYGRAPTWSDLAISVDIPTDDELRLSSKSRTFLESNSMQKSLFCVQGEPGSGKTTMIRRVAYDLAREGRIVFSLIGRAAIDMEIIVVCLSVVTKPYALLIDNAADHAQFINSILNHPQLSTPFLIIAAERSYRLEHIERLLGDFNLEYFPINRWSKNSLFQLIEKYRKNGFLASEEAIRKPEKFILKLNNDPIAIAVCRIINDFQPLESIIKSIWNHASENLRQNYTVVALAYYCYSYGVKYAVLEESQKSLEIGEQFSYSNPLPLAFSPVDDDYVIPLNTIISDRMLNLLSREKPTTLLNLFINLGNALAPFVNRKAIIDKTPEAILAGRLFNADKVVRLFLRDKSEQFYEETKLKWEWNSRYWEQRALLIQTSDIDTAIRYARHAKGIEEHPFTLTTLASLLLKKLDIETSLRDSLFEEAFELLVTNFKRQDDDNWRANPHPYVTLFRGVCRFIELDGTLSNRQRELIKSRISNAKMYFSKDNSVLQACDKVLQKLSE